MKVTSRRKLEKIRVIIGEESMPFCRERLRCGDVFYFFGSLKEYDQDTEAFPLPWVKEARREAAIQWFNKRGYFLYVPRYYQEAIDCLSFIDPKV